MQSVHCQVASVATMDYSTAGSVEAGIGRVLPETLPDPREQGRRSPVEIPTEPIGSIPRPLQLVEIAMASNGSDPSLDALVEAAVKDTIERFEATGSPVVTDGEQWKYHNFWTYCVHGLSNTQAEGFKIPFAAGHVRRMPRLTSGPFRYGTRADRHLALALRHAHVPVKQAVISPSALSLMYPDEGIAGYSRDQFVADLLAEHEAEVRACLELGAHCVQIDFTEGRLAMKIDPTGELLRSFVDLNNLALSRFSAAERARIIPVRGATATRRTARTSTTTNSCRVFFN